VIFSNFFYICFVSTLKPTIGPPFVFLFFVYETHCLLDTMFLNAPSINDLSPASVEKAKRAELRAERSGGLGRVQPRCSVGRGEASPLPAAATQVCCCSFGRPGRVSFLF